MIDPDGLVTGLAVYETDAENEAYRQGIHDGMAVLKAEQVRATHAASPGAFNAPLDVERLARAMCETTGKRRHGGNMPNCMVKEGPWTATHRAEAQAIAAEYARLTPPAPAPASEDGLLHDTREAIQEATGAMAAALPVILAVRAWRDTPRVASKGETVRQLGNRLEQAILDAMDVLDDYAEAHPSALRAVPAEAEEAPESAWLIEQGQPEGYSPPIYYALDQPRTAHYPAWTKDPFKARMFERRELAVAFMDSMRDGDRPMPGRPVEHGFIEGPVRPADALGGGEGLDVETVARLRKEAARESWWHQPSPDETGIYWGPTGVGFTRQATDAEWLAQAFREAVARAHEAGITAELRGFGDTHHLDVEDADYNCPHPWCVRWWPMVRAAEARARLTPTAPTPASEDGLP